MRENGSFMKKTGFTIAGNAVVRDMKLSLKGKGLYLLIMSYITLDSLTLTKSYLLKKCIEGEKAFCSAWDELKEAGYLKVHMTPGRHGEKGWRVEYELLDDAQTGAHTFYYSGSGEISNTNLTVQRANSAPECEIKRYPQKGIYADGSDANGMCANGNSGNGGNNIVLLRNTSNNNLFNTQSINLSTDKQKPSSDGLSEEEIRYEVEDDLFDETKIPQHYSEDKRRMLVAIKTLTDWYDLPASSFPSSLEKATFDMLVECLADMACEHEMQNYKGDRVTSEAVVERINEIAETDGSLFSLAQEAIDDYASSAKKQVINDKRKYMKSVIWNCFLTYRVKHTSFFAQTYGS